MNGAESAAALPRLHELMADFAARLQPAEPQVELPVTAAPSFVRRRRCVAFMLGDARYLIPLDHVAEVEALPIVTRLPHLPGWLLGVCNLRGNIVSVVDLARFLSLPTGPMLMPRLMVLRSLKEDLQIGMAVERLLGVRWVADDELRPAREDYGTLPKELITGMAQAESEPVALLDCEQILQRITHCQLES